MNVQANNTSWGPAVRGAIGVFLFMVSSPVWAVTYSTQYEMSDEPTVSVGVLDGNIADFNGDGLLTVGPAGTGATFAGGIMEYQDNTGGGNFGYYFAHSPPANTSFTIDIRVKVVSGVSPGGSSRSMSLSGGLNDGGNGGRNRGFQLNTGSVAFVNASGSVGSGSQDLTTNFVKLRITYNSSTNSYSCYNLDAATTLVAPILGGGTGGAGETSDKGGWAIGSLAGGSTTDTHYFMDYFRILIGTAFEDSTTVIDTIPAASCLTTVTPSAIQTPTGYELGATPAPTDVNYSVNNIGATTINWTATEVDCAGAAFNYPWLTLSAAGSSLAAGNSAAVNAIMSTTSLAAGLHTAYVKFTNDCPSGACFDEPFTYPNPNNCSNFFSEPCLVGQGGWTSTNPSNQIQEFSINGGTQLTLNGGGDSAQAHVATHAVSCTGTVISVKVDAKLGGNSPPNGNVPFWRFLARDASGNIIGRWQGTYIDIEAMGEAGNTAAGSLTASNKTMEMRINTGCRTTDYYFNGSFVVSYPWPTAATGTLANVEFQAIAGRGTSATDYVYLDNLLISGSNDVIRQIDLNVVGCSIQVQQPRIRNIGPCNSTAITTEVFTIKNNGSSDWTTFNAVQETGPGDNQHRPWLTGFTYTAGPVVRFATATVTATIDWSQVTVGEGASIKFGADCGSGFVYDKPEDGGVNTINVQNTTPAPVKLFYNGDVSPSANDSAGTGYKFALFEGIDQGAVVSDGGVNQAVDGFAYRLQDSGSSKTKWQSVLNAGGAAMNIEELSGSTAVARVKVAAASGSLFQSNLTILHGNLGAAYHWGGANNVVVETQRDVTAGVPGDGAYHIIRITSENTQIAGIGIVVNLYLDENPTPVLTINNALPSSFGTVEGIGFGAGSTTHSQDIYFDWVFGTNAGAFGPGEEVACIGLPPESNCNTPKVDTDDDDDVDMDDFAVFQTCFTGSLVSPPALSQQCDCYDEDNDNDIDTADFNAFVACETGPNVPWVTSVNCPN